MRLATSLCSLTAVIVAVQIFFGGAVRAQGAQQILVVGDSLTKEYAIEFPLLFPDNPQSWLARNWVELLHENRNAHFDLGSVSTFLDPRITGHEYNWGFPGATSEEIRERFESDSFFDQIWQAEFEDQVKNEVERVVVFVGGNDVEDYYDDIYNGASSSPFTAKTLDNVKFIVDTIRGMKSTIPIVLVAIPHVGCTPKVQETCPTHVTKTARVTTALDAMNANLANFATARNIGWAGGVYDLTKALISGPFTIGGVTFHKQADLNARPEYLFSGDGFHPNTCAHARVAQLIVDAFRARYTSPVISAVTENEMLDWIGVEIPTGYEAWLLAMGLDPDDLDFDDDPDGDGIPNLLEFLLSGLNANSNSLSQLPKAILQNISGQDMLSFTWLPRAEGLSFAQLSLLQSSNLSQWSLVPAEYITTNPDGSITARVPISGALFLKLSAVK